MKKLMIRDLALLGLSAVFWVPIVATAGNLEPTAGPADSASAMFSTDDIWNRLHSGAPGAKRNGPGPFAEPAAVLDPHQSQGKSLDEIMAVAPKADNVGGATKDDVAAGKSFWSLRTDRTDSTWGLQAQAGTGTVRSPVAPVPATGQATCYDAAGAVILACAGTGQDGALRKGVALPSPRFTDNSNGTVTDNLTGLIWLKNANCPDLSPMAWSEALTAVAGLHSGACGLSDGSEVGDWRTPNVKELFSLVNDQYQSPALSNTAGTAQWGAGDPFFNCMNASYWSSSNFVETTTASWALDLSNGLVRGSDKAESLSVWPVRGGQ